MIRPQWSRNCACEERASTLFRRRSEGVVQHLLQVEDLTIGYRSEDQEHQVALEGLRFDIAAGEAVGLLGESGCGKTTLGLALLGLLPPAAGLFRGPAPV